MSTTVAGVRFSDQMGALLDWATANGFRVEKDERGKSSKGVVIYAPDRDHPPISVDERGARFNRGHYENVRRDLYRAGCPPLPSDTKSAQADDPLESAVLADSPPGTRALRLGPIGLAETPALAELFDDADSAPQVVATIASSLSERVGVGKAEAALVGSVMETIVIWAKAFSGDRMAVLQEQIVAAHQAQHAAEVKAATDLAEEAEARANAAEKARERAEARGSETGRQLTEALARATAAEAEARALRDALAPLRAVLGQG